MNLALYTTIYPGSEPYLSTWYRSVELQTDPYFDVWVGLDVLTPCTVHAAIGKDIKAVWKPGMPGDTPTQIRQRALTQLADEYDAVVLVDCDDVLHPGRVEAARAALQHSDLAGCAQRLVDDRGQDLGAAITLPESMKADDVLPLYNVFGFSSSAYRCDLLQACLPAPAATVHLDWLLATRAWAQGRRLSFDRTVRMDYRQRAISAMSNQSPFRLEQVRQDAYRARDHFRLLLVNPLPNAVPERREKIKQVADSVEQFCERVVSRPEQLHRYVRQLNTLELAPVWWISVAHPSLANLWI